MPRASQEEKQKSHERILDAASKITRKKGIDAASVVDIMKTAGLTHGGFYRHFASKDDLMASGFRHAVDGTVGAIEQISDDEERAAAALDYVDRYLTPKHLNSEAEGCPIAAVASELVRQGGRTRSEATNAVKRVASLLDSEELSGDVVLAMLIGSLTLARLAETPQRAEAQLETAKRAIETLRKAS